MSKGVNKVILVGNLGKEPEVRVTQGGSNVASFSIATSESWKDKQTGQRQERTEWHNIVAFGRLADIVRDYLHKGSKVYVEGSLRTRKWQDKQGQDRYTTEIVASEMQMLDSRQSAPQHQAPQQQAPQQTNHNQGFAPQPAQQADIDDDIPF